jgi:hypothetical protein
MGFGLYLLILRLARRAGSTGSPQVVRGRLALQLCHIYGDLYYTRKLKKFNENRTFLKKIENE